MKQRSRFSFHFTFIAILSLSALAASNSPQSLAGQWRFNAAQSDNPQAKLDAALDTGGLLGSFKRKQANEALQRFINNAELLTIACRTDAITLSGKGTPERTLYLDGRKQQFETPSGEKTESTANWQSPQLVVRTSTERGARITQTYMTLPQSGQLQLLVRIESEHLKTPLVIRNVYDPVK